MICSNKLLANVELVLFLNKCDILDRKLKAGVRLAKYVKSFQERSNDSETVQKCKCDLFLFFSSSSFPLPSLSPLFLKQISLESMLYGFVT